jgi:hypothetical protein
MHRDTGAIELDRIAHLANPDVDVTASFVARSGDRSKYHWNSSQVARKCSCFVLGHGLTTAIAFSAVAQAPFALQSRGLETYIKYDFAGPFLNGWRPAMLIRRKPAFGEMLWLTKHCLGF